MSTSRTPEKLPVIDPRWRPRSERPPSKSRKQPFVRGFTVIAILGCIYYLCANVWTSLRGCGANVSPKLGVPVHVQKLWGQYAPWHPLHKYTPPPKHCNVTQVNILQRHGARYPIHNDSVEYRRSIRHLASAHKFTESSLDFLKDYQYSLGEEDLIPFGASQSFQAGESTYKRYSHLVNANSVPFVRAASEPRVVATAGNWTVGFAAATHQRYNPKIDVVISESKNNTLQNDCPNAGQGTVEMNEWLSIFGPPIAARLNKAAPGARLNETDVFNLMAMCPFETLATESKSPFCKLFTKNDFRAFEYHGDVEKYYKTGYGEPLGRVQGVGYVNELLARLTDSPVQDHTTHNSSLPFPLHRSIYTDFSHENLMVAVYAAIGLFNVTNHAPDPRKMPESGRRDRVWVASKMVPFSARMVTERLECGKDRNLYVRILVNDAVQPLEFCRADKHGLCLLDAFLTSQGYAKRDGDGDFDKCYG